MASTFAWMDYSEQQRRRMLDVIQQFRERTTRDELGLSGIRDAFADYLFPGTSTIQTRARYFLFTPWLYLTLERKRISSATATAWIRAAETKLIQPLAQSDDPRGTIGRIAQANVQRLPSSVYWQGLSTWGIRLFTGSQDEYHRGLDRFYEDADRHDRRRGEFAGESLHAARQSNWDPHIPPPSPEFPKVASFALTKAEAAYLCDQILRNCDKSFMAELLRRRVVDDVDMAWELPGIRHFPGHLKDRLLHARNFSEIIHGAALLYNLLIAEKAEAAEKVVDYRQQLDVWWDTKFFARRREFEEWDLSQFWQLLERQNPHIHQRARKFVESWIELAKAANDCAQVTQGTKCRQLVGDRERQLKGPLARLDNSRARELWLIGGGAAGAGQLDFRWRAARGILSDILQGLK